MKILYVVPKIRNGGGVARVIAIKANYFVKKFGYEVHILTQNEDDIPPFYDFDEKIIFHNMILKGNFLQFLNAYQKNIKKKIEYINPDAVLICDNGLKAYILPFILDNRIPIVFESHGSRFIEEKSKRNNFIAYTLKYWFKKYAASKFALLVVLSDENIKEWNLRNAVIIPNPSWINSETISELKTNKIITVARNSYEKGLDRLLLIWEKVSEIYPDWFLDIYTDDVNKLRIMAEELGINSNIGFYKSIKNIEEKYLESSIYIMTSRTEGFPMTLLEAMASGLPCVAYDCPCGPRAIIIDGKTGFLIEDGNIDFFIEKLSVLIQNKQLRIELGLNAKKSVANYNIDKIMNQWRDLLENLILYV